MECFIYKECTGCYLSLLESTDENGIKSSKRRDWPQLLLSLVFYFKVRLGKNLFFSYMFPPILMHQKNSKTSYTCQWWKSSQATPILKRLHSHKCVNDRRRKYGLLGAMRPLENPRVRGALRLMSLQTCFSTVHGCTCPNRGRWATSSKGCSTFSTVQLHKGHEVQLPCSWCQLERVLESSICWHSLKTP